MHRLHKPYILILTRLLLLALCCTAFADESDVEKAKKALKTAKSQRSVIYNLDCTEFFVGSFGDDYCSVGSR